MTYKMKITAAALTGMMLAAPIAQAQDAKPEADDMPMAEGHSMNGEMSGMKMMSDMGPMMEACTEMMQSMTDHMNSAHGEDQKG